MRRKIVVHCHWSRNKFGVNPPVLFIMDLYHNAYMAAQSLYIPLIKCYCGLKSISIYIGYFLYDMLLQVKCLC